MIEIQAVDHIGIRVADRERAVAFYRQLGFEPVYEDEKDPVVIVRNSHGVEINFILNGRTPPEGKNVLMDVADKHPGYTHVAFRVESIDETVKRLGELGIEITEGPVRLGDGSSLFVRDPDRNVVELRSE